MEKQSFLKTHGDAITIIGVNIALAAIMMSMWISNTHRIDAGWQTTNARIDATMSRIDGMYEVLINHVKPKPTRNIKSIHEER